MTKRDESGREIKKFIAEHKFELLEDFQMSAPLSLPSLQQTTAYQLEKQSLEVHCTSENWKQKYYSSKVHPIKLMVGSPNSRVNLVRLALMHY